MKLRSRTRLCSSINSTKTKTNLKFNSNSNSNFKQIKKSKVQNKKFISNINKLDSIKQKIKPTQIETKQINEITNTKQGKQRIKTKNKVEQYFNLIKRILFDHIDCSCFHVQSY
jgi:hypothetical protein